jgi:hypothetical protein
MFSIRWIDIGRIESAAASAAAAAAGVQVQPPRPWLPALGFEATERARPSSNYPRQWVPGASEQR